LHNNRIAVAGRVVRVELVFINKDLQRMSIDSAENSESPKKPNFATAGALVLAAALLAGCSSVPDWANPVEWYEGAADAISGNDEPESARPSDAKVEQETPGGDRKFPNLASVPDRPAAPTEEERKRLAEQLTADRENAKYSEETIKRQSAVARPPASSTPVQPSARPLPPPPPQTASVPPAPQSFPRLGPTPPSRPPQFAAPPPRAEATVPPGSAVRSLANRPSPSTRSVSRIGNPTFGAPPADIAASLGGGAPAAMSDGFAPSPLAPIAGTRSAQQVTAGEPVGVVRFKAGSASLSSRERQGLRQIAQVFRQRGGAIRVEGHASSRTRNMDPVQHHLVNFNVSLNRANAVARELVRQGVPEEAVFVSALSDSRPLYYEVMPAGEAGNQRVEVYFVN
jgi:outer membrane protein OmpA-like peptidoglycan-associated protein